MIIMNRSACLPGVAEACEIIAGVVAAVGERVALEFVLLERAGRHDQLPDEGALEVDLRQHGHGFTAEAAAPVASLVNIIRAQLAAQACAQNSKISRV